MSSITENVKRILSELPEGVRLEAAVKTRTPDEIMEAIDAGVTLLGENYVQEAEKAREVTGSRAEWHFIGHLQSNKVKKGVDLFDMIETVDSLKLASSIDRHAREAGKVMPILIEINSGREPQKSGVLPEEVENLVREIASLENVRIKGLMTMGPATGDPEASRPFFRETKHLYDSLKNLDLPGVEMTCLSMGMTNSWEIAIEEGANIVRLGSLLFGPRQ